jgi:hypothetical protein
MRVFPTTLPPYGNDSGHVAFNSLEELEQAKESGGKARIRTIKVKTKERIKQRLKKNILYF